MFLNEAQKVVILDLAAKIFYLILFYRFIYLYFEYSILAFGIRIENREITISE
jgi:hypothetical protein